MYAVCNKNRVLAQMQCRGKEQNPVWGHHLNQRLSENHAGPFVFGGNIWNNKTSFYGQIFVCGIHSIIFFSSDVEIISKATLAF